MKLLKQFPFLNTIKNRNLNPFERQYGPNVDDLTIKVERADGNLMYRAPDHVGTNGSKTRYFTVVSGPKSGLIGKQGEYCYAISHDGEVINSLWQPFHDDKQPVYGSDVLWGVRSAGMKSDALFESTAYIVWVTVTVLYKKSGSENWPCGDFVERSMSITVYRPPSEGFSKLEHNATIEDHLWLSNRVLTDAALSGDQRISGIGTRLHELGQVLYETVYSQGMKQTLEEGGWKGHSASFDEVEVKAVWGFQRVGVELSNSTTYVEFHIHDDSNVMYMGAVQGRLPEVRKLVISTIQAWSDEEKRKDFTSDESVKNFGQVLSEMAKS